MAEPHKQEEHFDVLTKTGEKTGLSKSRYDFLYYAEPRKQEEHFDLLSYMFNCFSGGPSAIKSGRSSLMKIINISGGLSPSCVIMVPFYCQLLEWLKIHWVSSVLYLSQIVWEKKGDVHRDGDYHRAVHVWIFAESTQELLLQLRADCKDSWAGLWDISSAGHISAGDSSLETARRELQEELGVILPKDAFELIFIFLHETSTNGGQFINNEFEDVYLVTTLDPIPLEAFTLQESEVSAVKYIHYLEYKNLLANEDPEYVPYDVNAQQYGQLFDIIARRYKVDNVARSLSLQKQLQRYASVSLNVELTGLSDADKGALDLLIKAAAIMDEIFNLQVWYSNPYLRDWLEKHAAASQLDKLKWAYYLINKTPWSCLDENEAYLTTADSAIKLLPEATRRVSGWKGLEYKAAFPSQKPPGANFYPPDMDKMEFTQWKDSLPEDQQNIVAGFFSVIKRHSESNSDSSSPGSINHLEGPKYDLYNVPFSQEYNSFLSKAAELLRKAGDRTSSPSLRRLLHSKADAFLSNDYYESDIAWMELDSKLDVTIGPYETYEDTLFGYKATFEAFIGIRDDKGTAQVLEQNLPMDDAYKSKDVSAAPIRVVQLLYNAGDVKGPQTVAFNLPNDERIVKDRGTSMVMLKNVSEAKFKHILQPIADVCITNEQREFVDFDSFFTHTICHECCHGIGPHSITLPNGKKSTVRLELQELHSALEEAKADIVGLWALRFLTLQGLLPGASLKSVYATFLVGCFRSVRFGLLEAHGKGQALQFNWLYEKEAFVLNPDETFSVNFDKVEDAVESLSREILTIQARGDKESAKLLLQKYGVMSEPLKLALHNLEQIQVPVDIAPEFPVANGILGKKQF
ncbi:nudix hydrolase 3-like isoform X1 [Cucumis melo var. makuwa]|uniref:Nudix hydrolase 3-like isoform X1 n=1 Tax=Cucumis melo var. makuwa TaxID=1194695 RepID=A0A5A7UVI1_CUCMM|nr:nudix hydrolase 3-like isoform X1 [Cucumis melo var. makuwa]